MKKINLSKQIKKTYNLKSSKTKTYKKYYNKIYNEVKRLSKGTTGSYNYYIKKIINYELNKRKKTVVNKKPKIDVSCEKNFEQFKKSENKMFKKLYDEKRIKYEGYDKNDYEFIGEGFNNYLEQHTSISNYEKIQTALTGMNNETLGRLLTKADKGRKIDLKKIYYGVDVSDKQMYEDENLINMLETISPYLSQQRQDLIKQIVKSINDESKYIL